MTRPGLSWFPLHDRRLYSDKTMLALFCSHQELNPRALALVVLSSPRSSICKSWRKRYTDFSMGSKTKYPWLLLAHKAIGNTTLQFPCHSWDLSGLWAVPSEDRRAFPYASASLPPPPQQSASACAILFSHVSSASTDFQLTRVPAPAPSTSFICLSKYVIHPSLPSPSPVIECL